MCECSCLYLLVVILPLGIIDHFTVLLLLIAVLKGCGDEIFFSVPPVLEDARKVFENIPEWNVVLRSNMNVGYAMNNGILEPSSLGCGLDQD